MCGVAAAVLQGAGAPAVSVVRADPRTGRLVRSVLRTGPAAERATASAPSVPPSGLAGASGLAETVDRIAQQNQLSPRLVHSVIQVESNYDPNAVSPKGAQGLMQLIPSTARRFGVSNVFDPADNIQGGARYLKYLLGLVELDPSLRYQEGWTRLAAGDEWGAHAWAETSATKVVDPYFQWRFPGLQ